MDEQETLIAEIVATDLVRRAQRQLCWVRVQQALHAGVDAETIAEALGMSRATLYRRLADLAHKRDEEGHARMLETQRLAPDGPTD